MKVIFVSNYFNHHQQPFSDAMYERLGDDYIFLATDAIEEERIKMGWQSTGRPHYVKQTNYKDKQEVEIWSDIIERADVVIGSAYYYKLLLKRMKSRKLTFLYSERLYKTNSRLLKAPVHAYRACLLRHSYMLCASAYTAFDYALTGNFRKKCFKWGYFPILKEYDNLERLIGGKGESEGLKHQQDVSILWVARLIGLKHPEMPVKLAQYLKSKGYKFRVKIIGNGPLEYKLHRMVESHNLSECVELLGPKTPEEVREYMECSNIFLFTSDRNEGWGAVLNESMNSCCAVIANSKIGSVPYLLKNGENGFSYDSEKDFFEKAETLVKDSALRKKFGANAYRTMAETWNAQKACENFFQLIDTLKVHSELTISEGPCSNADVIWGF